MTQRAAWRIFSNWSGAFENSLSSSLIVCQTIRKLSCSQFFLGRPTLLWSTANGAAELLRKLTILIGWSLSCRRMCPTNAIRRCCKVDCMLWMVCSCPRNTTCEFARRKTSAFVLDLSSINKSRDHAQYFPKSFQLECCEAGISTVSSAYKSLDLITAL